jgi:hypothetical protein
VKLRGINKIVMKLRWLTLLRTTVTPATCAKGLNPNFAATTQYPNQTLHVVVQTNHF